MLSKFAPSKGKKYDYFISYSRRSAKSCNLAAELYDTLTSLLGFKVWMDVKMPDRSDAAMQKGVEESKFFIAILCRPSINPENNAYFTRENCVMEMRWARGAGVQIIPVVHDTVMLNVAVKRLLRVGAFEGDSAALDRTMARLSSDGGGSFPPELEAWSEKMGLSAATQAKVLAYLCNEDDGNFGANCMGDLKNLKSEHIEHIVDLVPPAKKRVARQVLKAAGGAGAAHWWEYFEGPKGASRPSVEAGGHHGSGGAVDDDGRYLRPANTDPLGSLGDGSSLRITDDSVLVTAPLSGSASFTGFHVRDRIMAALQGNKGQQQQPSKPTTAAVSPAVDKKKTAELVAAKNAGRWEKVRALAGAPGVDVNGVDEEYGRTTLWSAAFSGRLELVRFLAAQGANVKTPNKFGTTPLAVAAGSGHLEVVRFLAAQGANVDTPSKSGVTPLNAAAGGGHFDVVRFLVAQGAMVDTPNKHGITPLVSAVRSGKTAVAAFLRSKGAT